MNLLNNYWFFKDGFTKKQCDSIIKNQKKIKKHRGTIGTEGDGNVKANLGTRNSNVSWVVDEEIHKFMFRYIDTANKNAGWNFETSWTEDIQFTEYKKNQHYNWHNDMFAKPYQKHTFPKYNGLIRKISCSILLNDPKKYEGGDFEIGYTNNFYKGNIDKHKHSFNKTNAKQGSVIVFPSFIWHRVTPVTKGTRYSLVSWTLGKPYV